MHCSRLKAHAQNRDGPPKLLTSGTQYGPYAGKTCNYMFSRDVTPAMLVSLNNVIG